MKAVDNANMPATNVPANRAYPVHSTISLAARGVVSRDGPDRG